MTRIFALSDLHVDHDVNADWVDGLSRVDYVSDVLILAGDVTDNLDLLRWCLATLARRFFKVLFVPGNHDLWVARDRPQRDSFEKFAAIVRGIDETGASMEPFNGRNVTIVPLFGWYDYSFGSPSDELMSIWMDYRACRWPTGTQDADVAQRFDEMNEHRSGAADHAVISFSHFLPRIDLMPAFIPPAQRVIYPVLGTTRLERRIRALGSSLHVYGHSHVNRRVRLEGVSYINNAFGYPAETRIASKDLLCVHEYP